MVYRMSMVVSLLATLAIVWIALHGASGSIDIGYYEETSALSRAEKSALPLLVGIALLTPRKLDNRMDAPTPIRDRIPAHAALTIHRPLW